MWKKALEKWQRPVGAGTLEVELLSERRSSLESRRIRKEVLELSAKHPRYGYRRITTLLRREGFEVNVKRVARIRREEGIKVSKKQRRMKRLGLDGRAAAAERPGQVWSWDFVVDQTENGSSFRILTLLDEHTRQCLAIHPAWSIRAVDSRPTKRLVPAWSSPPRLRKQPVSEIPFPFPSFRCADATIRCDCAGWPKEELMVEGLPVRSRHR